MALLDSVLEGIARQHIIAIWDAFIEFESNVGKFNAIRKLLGLSSLGEAAKIARYASDYAQTDIGRLEIECGYYNNCDGLDELEKGKVVIDPNARFRIHIFVQFGDAKCSRWVDFQQYPSYEMLENAANTIAEDCAADSPNYMKAYEKSQGEVSHFEIIDIRRIE